MMSLHSFGSIAIPLLMGLCVSASPVLSAVEPEANISWEAGVDGVVIEWGADGAFERIFSQYTQPVSIPNSRGIRNAKIIAEEKAKAAVVRFLEQSIATERVTSEIANDMETGTARSSDGGEVQFSESATSTAMTSLREFTTSYASGELRGVIRLEEGYDPDAGEAWVKVGISRKTMGASRAVRDALVDDGQSDSDDAAEETGQVHRKAQKGHVRKNQSEDW